MDGNNPHLTSALDDYLCDKNRCEYVFITHIHATNVVSGLRRHLAGFYVTVEIEGKTTKTSNKPISVDEDVVKWDEEILLPSERSSAILFKVYASFEFGSRLGNGELLCELKVSIGDVLDRSEQLRPDRFLDNEVLQSCLSLRIITERRICEVNESAKSLDLPETDAMSQLTQLTDTGHRALLRYRQLQDQKDVDEAIACFGRVRDTCPPDHPSRSTVLSNLVTSRTIHCQASNSYVDLDVPVALYRDALRLRISGHSDHCATAFAVGFALLARSQTRGDEATRIEVKGIFTRVVELSPMESYEYRAARLVLETPVSIRTMESRASERENEDPDDETIRDARTVLFNLVDRDPRRPALLGVLGVSLYHRFNRNSDLADVHEAISMLENAVQLTPDGHPDKPAWLNNLGSSLARRFEHLGDLADINKSTSMFGKAVRLTPSSHPDKPTLLSNLGSSLSCRFERFGDVADMNKSILIHDEALRLIPNGHPNKLAWLDNLGSSLSRRFDHLGDLADINKSISVFEEAVRLTPVDCPDKPGRLNNLGKSLLSRFDRHGDLADMKKSIAMQEEAVHLTPNDHPDKPTRLNDLGMSLYCRFQHFGNLADINMSISMTEEALRLTPNGHLDKPAWLCNLGNLLFRRFDRLGGLADINKSISVQEEALYLTSNDHPDKPTLLSNLGSSLLSRFEHHGDLADMSKSVLMTQEAVDFTPSGHPSKPGRLNNLGNSLYCRFEHLGELPDITTSISMQEEAIHLTPHDHPDKPVQLSNLGKSLCCRFEHLGNLADINMSISTFEEAVHLIPDSHPDRPAWLNYLGVSLYRRFHRLGDLSDIDKAISMHGEAVHLTPTGHPDKSIWLSNLGMSLLSRFDRLGDLSDINESVLVSEKAVYLALNGHPDKPARLTTLGNSLFRRFQRLGDIADINKSILMFEEAAHLTPNDRPSRQICLTNLGSSLLSRFEHLGCLVDINESVSVQEDVLHLTPNDHPDKPGRLNNLGTSLHCRFEHLGDATDINRSISIFEEAVRLTPNGHPDKPSWLNNLGNSFMTCFLHSHDPSCLSAATLHFSLATRTPTGSTTIRFITARRWIASARLENNTQALIDAYTATINLLPELAWLGLPLAERHRVLLNAADVARDAAAAALEAGYPEMAVEWLEQGRSIVWTQFLQLRTPVDELRVEHPSLADRFRHISQELEQAGSRQVAISHGFANNMIASVAPPEKDVQRHHDLALTREKLLLEIRSLPGFDRFLLPKTIKQLSASAHSGPVVYLNASEHRCDALIIMAEFGKVISLPLRGVSHPEVEQLHNLLCLLLKRNGLIIPRDEIFAVIPNENPVSRHLVNTLLIEDSIEYSDRAVRVKPQRVEGYKSDDLFQIILAFLWENVVHPILEVLGFSTLPSGVEKMAHIFWCPTGPFTFLPIHAAGLYGVAGTGAKLSDFAISSYIPTLGALAPSAQKDGPSNIRLVTVPQPPTDGLNVLASVPKEIDHIRILSATSPFVTLQESHGSIEDVTEKMKHSDWVHFACHGVQDPDNPLDSGLCLAGERRLKLSDIIRLSRPRGGLAFLSACQTARGDEQLPEESVHLAAGMLLAGYGGVIATMWEIKDSDAPKVTKDVYEHLFRDGKVPDSLEAAEALHYAVQRLRDSGASFSSWVPFIHVGR